MLGQKFGLNYLRRVNEPLSGAMCCAKNRLSSHLRFLVKTYPPELQYLLRSHPLRLWANS